MPPQNLTPFVSLTLMTPPKGKNAQDAVAEVSKAAKEMLPEVDLTTKSWKRLKLETKGPGTIEGHVYERQVQVNWTTDRVLDLQHHLLLVIWGHGYIAVHATDPKLQDRLTAALLSTKAGCSLTGYVPVARAKLEAAFVVEGEAKSLWLKGMHARNALKADAKILSGDNLAFALDVFGDQTFWWSAARARNPTLEKIVGVSAKASRVWLHKVNDTKGFRTETCKLLKHLSAARPGKGLRVLASPELTVDLEKLNEAYDVSLMPPDFGVELDWQDVTVDDLALDACAASFLVKGNQTNADFEIELRLNGKSVATAQVEVKSARAVGQVRFKVSPNVTTSDSNLATQANRILRTIGRGDGVNVHYDSGYSISGRKTFKTVRHRVEFTRFVEEEFDPAQWDIGTEKPSALDKIGQEKSLFCWLQKQLKGHLMCDDGSMEKADFFHIDSTCQTLTFYHVKGSHSADAERQISVSAYEVVTAQAIKNLIWLDKNDFLRGLKARIRPDNQYWKNGGDKSTHNEFYCAVEKLSPEFKRKVVLLQPSLLKKVRDDNRGKANVQGLRLRQLEFLLAAAEQTCRSLSTEFEVICAK
ncbi:MAG: hypothetical protein IM669_06930 [Phenylobacterium sp.]|uniref:hypothetical protein n=1 Tax=Phenylobacterium sp. TaxID=1871053 RepID=UPI0025FC2D35|nr:hypothetical protein [Phenylobacterium sp.]MCA3757245.1 hypothetical protein [Phenylobacterium sp.]